MTFQRTANQRPPWGTISHGTDNGNSEGFRTIWGRSKLSLPIVLKTRSCSLLTIPSKSSPRDAMLLMEGRRKDARGKRAQDFDASRRKRSQACVLPGQMAQYWRVYMSMECYSGASSGALPKQDSSVLLVWIKISGFQGSWRLNLMRLVFARSATLVKPHFLPDVSGNKPIHKSQ